MSGRRRSARADVCVVGLRGFPDVLGGVETHCEQLFGRLSRISAYRYVVLGRGGYIQTRRINARLEVRPIGALRNKYLEALPNALLSIVHAYTHLRPRILHIHAIGPALVAPLAKLLGMQVVVTHHGRDYKREKWNWLARLVLRLGEAAALRFADRVIVVSPSLAQDLRHEHPTRANRIVYIPNGAEPGGAEAASREMLTRLGVVEGKYVLAVCRLVPEKRLEDLITAMRAARPDLKLVIAGAADHRDAYANKLVGEADDQIIFAGWQDRRQLATLYAHASLFVLPSSHEGLPIAALEAIGGGAPVVLSDLAANRDIGLPARHYFPVGDVAALTEKLRAPHASYGVDRARVMSAFDWDRIAADTLRVYDDLTGRPRTRLAYEAATS